MSNAFLASFEAYGWSCYYSKYKGDARDNKYLGLTGEVIVADYLRLNAAPYARRLKSLNDKVGSPHFSSTAQLSSHFNSLVTIGGWDDDKSVDILYSLNLGNKSSFELGINMRFNDVNGKPINEKGGGEKFNKPVNFAIEVNTGSSIQNFTKGFSQALNKAKKIPNGIAVVAMDHDAYLKAIENENFKNKADDYLKAGGRLMLIGSLNENALKLREKSGREVQKGSNAYTVSSK